MMLTLCQHSHPTAETVILFSPCRQCRTSVCSFPFCLARLWQKCLLSPPMYGTFVASSAFATRKIVFLFTLVYHTLGSSGDRTPRNWFMWVLLVCCGVHKIEVGKI